MNSEVRDQLIAWAEKYNDPQYFQEDPIAFPRKFASKLEVGEASLQDVEVSAVFASHFAWGRRAMIVRDCERLFDEMGWKPYEYVMAGEWRNDDTSIHRTIKWSEVAGICRRLREWYTWHESLEPLSQAEMRSTVFHQKEDAKAPNKKINMMRRWMVRNDGIVDLGLWKNTNRKDLIIPLDVHVHRTALELGLTKRNSANLKTAMEITEALREVFPEDPCLGDFALFAWSVTQRENKENNNKN